METPTKYPFFESGQVLTNTHLNDLRRFLDENNRLTRIRLSGTGIVCGLNYYYDSGLGKLTVYAGFGISTSGYLIELTEDVEFTKFHLYSDPATENYQFGKADPNIDVQPDDDDITYRSDDEDDDEIVVEAYELLKSNTTETDATALNTLSGLSGKVLVLYLELLDTDLKSCTGSNCDNKGMERSISVKALLLDPGLLNSEYETTVLPQLNIPKTIHDSLDSPNLSLDIVDVSTNNLLDNLFDNISNTQKTVLYHTLGNNYAYYGPALEISSQRVSDLVSAIGVLGEIGSGVKETYRQYVFDALKDITFAWNEFADQFNEMMGQYGGCFSNDDYPRHLGLGIVSRPVTGFGDDYRNIFRPSPANSNNNEKLAIVKMLFAKMEELVYRFSVPAARSAAIDITPDQPQLAPHSGRSIPYYYTISDASSALLKYWAPYKTVRFRKNERYAYYAERYTSDLYFTQPMRYLQDGHPLLRIEGIKGQNIDDALKKINELKELYDLAFPVKVLYFSEGTGKKVVTAGDDSNFFYEDLQEDYYFLREKPIRMIDGLVLYLSSTLPYLNDISTNPKSDSDTKKNASDTAALINEIIRILNLVKEKLLGLFPPCLPVFADQFDTFKNTYRNLIRALMKSLLDSGLLDGITSASSATDPNALSQMSLINEGISLVTDIIGNLTEAFWFTKYYNLYVKYLTRKHRSRAKAQPFEEFAKDHCGMEHLAGTYTYGTFILVCKPDSVSV